MKKNGEVYVSRPLDRELVSSYRLEVVVTDGVFVSRCRVTIEILDDNDSPPVCDRCVLIMSTRRKMKRRKGSEKAFFFQFA